jgi:hypothetical protein
VPNPQIGVGIVTLSRRIHVERRKGKKLGSAHGIHRFVFLKFLIEKTRLIWTSTFRYLCIRPEILRASFAWAAGGFAQAGTHLLYQAKLRRIFLSP